MVELSTRKREIREDGGNHHEKLGLRELRVRVNWPSPIRQVQIPMWQVPTPIRCLINPITEVIPLICQVSSYLPSRSDVHPASLSFSSTTLPSLNVHKVESSLSISPWHHHELTPSAAFAKCSIREVQHTRSGAYTKCSIRRVQHTPSAAYAECSIHCVQPTPSAAYTEYSIHLGLSVLLSFSWC